MPQMVLSDQERTAYDDIMFVLNGIPVIHKEEIPVWIVKDKEAIAKLFPVVAKALGLPTTSGRLPDELKITPFVMLSLATHALTGKALVPIYRRNDNALVSFSWWAGATPAMMAQAKAAEALQQEGEEARRGVEIGPR